MELIKVLKNAMRLNFDTGFSKAVMDHPVAGVVVKDFEGYSEFKEYLKYIDDANNSIDSWLIVYMLDVSFGTGYIISLFQLWIIIPVVAFIKMSADIIMKRRM